MRQQLLSSQFSRRIAFPKKWSRMMPGMGWYGMGYQRFLPQSRSRSKYTYIGVCESFVRLGNQHSFLPLTISLAAFVRAWVKDECDNTETSFRCSRKGFSTPGSWWRSPQTLNHLAGKWADVGRSTLFLPVKSHTKSIFRNLRQIMEISCFSRSFSNISTR